jgi:ATP-dependent protease Clp ATPase subunit
MEEYKKYFLYNCSFCGNYKEYVRFLVIGPEVSICDSCSELALDICMQERKKEKLKIDELKRKAMLVI